MKPSKSRAVDRKEARNDSGTWATTWARMGRRAAQAFYYFCRGRGPFRSSASLGSNALAGPNLRFALALRDRPSVSEKSRRLLAQRLRLARPRSRNESVPPFHGRDRRHRSSLYSRARGRQRTVSTVVDARLAGLNRRIPETAPDADTSFSVRRQCARCVHRCCALHSRVWLLIPRQPAPLRSARDCRYLQPFNDGGAGISQVRRPWP